MSLNPWKNGGTLNHLESISQKWMMIPGAIIGGVLGYKYSPPFGLIAGTLIGVISAALVHMFLFGLVVTPILMFFYAFIEIFQAVLRFFTSKDE